MSLPQNTTSTENEISKLSRTNLQVISLMAMLGGWSLLLAYIIGYFISRDARFINLIVLEIVYGIALTVAWILQWRGYHRGSTWLIFISTFATGFLFTYTIQGLGLTLGVMLAIVFSMIAWQTLPRRNAILAVMVSLFAGALIFYTDANFAQGDRIEIGRASCRERV